MIKADFIYSDGGFRLCLCGHADYREDGDDIVCAAVSGIFYATLGYLANSACSLKINRLGSGVADIECDEGGLEALKLACIGLIQIGLTYKGCIKVTNSIFKWNIASPREA